MNADELKKEAEELIQRFEIANSMNCYMQLTPDRKQIGEMLVMIVEPREKRIAELEQENALLKGRNEGFEQQIMGLLIKYEEIYKRFPDLKNAMDKAKEVLKENAELQQKWLDESYEKAKFVKENVELKEKAIHIIRNLLTLSMPIDYAKCPGPLQKIAEAENFLKESEVEK